jgi:MFS family permease
MATLDSSIVNIALPSITSAFRTGLVYSRWVVIIYFFTITGLILFFGKLADVFGRKWVFNWGFVIFTLGSALCGCGKNIQQLILFRALQGFGAAMIMANGPAIITSAFPANERGKALGTLGMVVSSGLVIGPTLGGLLVKNFHWPSIFFVNIPFGILGTYLVYRNLPSSEGRSAYSIPGPNLALRFRSFIYRLAHFDWFGSILWFLIQFGYTCTMDHENALGLGPVLRQLIMFGTAGLFFLFLIWELSLLDPVLDFGLFKARSFLVCNISSLFSFIAISSVTLLLPFYFQSIRGLPPDHVGMLMTAIPMTIFFVAPVSGRLSDVYGARVLSSVGLAVLCIAMAFLAVPWQGLVTENTSIMIIYLIFIGFGVGLFQSPNNNAIMGSVTRTHLGVASAMIATIRNFGFMTGAALGSSLLMFYYSQQVKLGASLANPLPPAANFISSLRHTFLTIAVLCSVGIFTSILNPKRIENRANADFIN